MWKPWSLVTITTVLSAQGLLSRASTTRPIRSPAQVALEVVLVNHLEELLAVVEVILPVGGSWISSIGYMSKYFRGT